MSFININSKILCDTREQKNDHILKAFEKNDVNYKKQKLDFGDYAIESDDGFRPNLVIERKANLDELIGNIFEKCDEGISCNRIHKEIIRCISCETRMIILIEDPEWYPKLLKGEFRSKANPKAVTGLVISLLAKYSYYLTIMSVDKKYTASFINNILKYELKEQLKMK